MFKKSAMRIVAFSLLVALIGACPQEDGQPGRNPAPAEGDAKVQAQENNPSIVNAASAAAAAGLVGGGTLAFGAVAPAVAIGVCAYQTIDSAAEFVKANLNPESKIAQDAAPVVAYIGAGVVSYLMTLVPNTYPTTKAVLGKSSTTIGLAMMTHAATWILPIVMATGRSSLGL